MPRSGWIALGAIVGAILGADATRRGATAIALIGTAILLAAWAMARIGTLHRGTAEAGRGAVHRVQGGVRALGFVAIGILLVAARILVTPPVVPPFAAALPAGDGPWVTTIESIGAQRTGQQPAVLILDAPAGMRVAGTLPGFPVVVPGDRVTLDGSLRAPPADGPYGDYLVRIGVQATIRVSRMRVEPPTGDLARSLEGLRRAADRALRLAVPEPEAGLASGILIGLRDRVDRDLSAAFTAVGATHVVAISGWNIAIVATTLAALAGRVARRRRMLLTALAIVAYVVFVGPSPSVLRAAGMAGVVMLARELGRPSRAAAAIGWAVVALLAVDPRLVEDVGFRLSALATVGLIAWGTPFAEHLAGKAPGRPRAWLAESLGVSLAAQLATLPIVVLSFGRLSLVSPLVNLGVVPLVAPAMGAGLVALGGGLLAMAGLPSALATLVGLPAWLLFSLMVGMVRAGATLPFASVPLVEPWNAVVAAGAGLGIVAATALVRRPSRGKGTGGGGAIGAAARVARGEKPPGVSRQVPSWWRTRSGRILAGGLAASMIALAVVVVQRPTGIPRVTVLDVGQGDAILLEGGSGGRLLVDGGPDPGRLLVALDERLPPWDRRIDVVILSHPHEDHAAGLAALIGRYAVAQVFEPGMFGPGPGYAALDGGLIALGIPRGTLSTGDRVTVDEFRLQVLWPDPGAVPERPSDGGTGINNVSIVLLGEVNGHRLLLAGDIEEEIDPQLLARGLPPVDLLKVAHHGSRTSSTDAFLEAVRPAVAVISAGRDNPYGHPAPATVARLEAAGARVLRTDTNGTVTVDLGAGPLRARYTGARAASGPLVSSTTASGAANTAASGAANTAASGAAATSTSGTATAAATWASGAAEPATADAFLCGVPGPSPGIVAPRPPTADPPTAVAGSASTAPPDSTAGIASTARPDSTAVIASHLGYDAARDPRTPHRQPPTPAVLARRFPERRLGRRSWPASTSR
ncbi:MAG: ComEC/Rec2 family competence protein [Chloroflexota bacterium]